MVSSRMPILSGRRVHVLGISKVDKARELVEAVVHEYVKANSYTGKRSSPWLAQVSLRHQGTRSCEWDVEDSV